MSTSFTNNTRKSGTVESSFTYTPEPGMNFGGLEAARWHVKWLRNHGIHVEVEERRYDFRIFIDYNTEEQFRTMTKWIAWHIGLLDSIGCTMTRAQAAEAEEYILQGGHRLFK